VALARADFKQEKKRTAQSRFELDQPQWADARKYIDTLLELNLDLYQRIKDGTAGADEKLLPIIRIYDKAKEHYPSIPITSGAFRNWLRDTRGEAYKTVAKHYGRQG